MIEFATACCGATITVSTRRARPRRARAGGPHRAHRSGRWPDGAPPRGQSPAPLPVRGGMTPRLAGKVAIVTGAGCVGAGWGNGRAIAVRLAEEGARVFAVDRDPARVEETLRLAGAARGSIEPWVCDVTSAESVAAMVAACVAAHGTVDILVNNAGGSAAAGRDDRGSLGFPGGHEPEERVHLQAFTRARRVRRHRGIASPPGFAGPAARSIYAATKAGVIQLSRGRGAARRAGRACQLWCGKLHTPISSPPCDSAGGDAEALLAQRRESPGFMGDGATPRTPCSSCGDEARFITGTEIVVDGGMTARCD